VAATADRFVLVDAGHPHAVAALATSEAVWLPSASVKAALGWDLKPEGLCRDDVCIPLPADPADARGVPLAALAVALRRPLALDLDERAAYLGVAAPDRAAALASLEAPGFALPDLGGRVHSLSEHRGKKVLLVAYASW
jgi:hypothetical protein